MKIKYQCEGCDCGFEPCVIIISTSLQEDSGAPISCLYGGGTKEFTLTGVINE